VFWTENTIPMLFFFILTVLFYIYQKFVIGLVIRCLNKVGGSVGDLVEKVTKTKE